MYPVHSSKSSQQHKLYIIFQNTIALLIASEYKVHLWSDVHSLYTFTDSSGIVQNQLKKKLEPSRPNEEVLETTGNWVSPNLT